MTDAPPTSPADTLQRAQARRTGPRAGRAIVQLADKTADQPRAPVLIGIFVACLALGIALPWLCAHPPGAARRPTTHAPTPPQHVQPASPPPRPAAPAASAARTLATPPCCRDAAVAHAEPANAPAPKPDGAVAAALAGVTAPKLVAAAARPVASLDQPVTAPATTPVAATDALAASASATTPVAATGSRARRPAIMKHGFVAYLHCAGLERAGRRYPCPRDPELEARVWRVLGDLPGCHDANPGTGRGELRFTWHGPGPAKIEWRALEPSADLDLTAVSKCADNALAKQRSRLRSAQLMVGFRFELR